jgi:hypothetical protein
MIACLVWYGHAPAGTAFRRVAGLTLFRRAVLSAQAAGFEHVVAVVPDADERRAKAELAGDVRLRTDVLVLAAPAERDEVLRHLPDDEAREYHPPAQVVASASRSLSTSLRHLHLL